ncbi:class I SAM-dependent methyltransferase [Leptospira interrogans]|uniref:Methionine biosynthesis protein MetW-like protein n=2 Tax=Leptospira interrogans TaxID=173 RepID=M6GAX9_LEPIR|nr:class I SAM-dependent methyltransferase [Leptospira interrogans]EMM81920.1 methionine biosynthesis protein MetW-like protein [Leptospira interrogans str. 2006001854]ALE38961.1 S-adenosylmethionine-dependent methyltransferase [Leptospira interrogans serovar Hardjo str. Norma]ALO00161.1 methyltransferase [Leptospira interrogans serovar Hardjo-prajitno]EJP14534.1 methionine biosynthesis protein MetW-like protein [Leptospira interrogans str. FPW2026]EKO95843.1 methionine biosynthesis protein Me
MNQNLKEWWNSASKYGESLFNRTLEKTPEMESAKSLAKILDSTYKKGMKILDVGCGPGHFLVSLRKRIDSEIDYTGYDFTQKYVDMANDHFKGSAKFYQGEVSDIKFEDATFDIVMCNNVLLHLPPNLKKPLSELIRVSKKLTIVRTLFGKGNYIVKDVNYEEEFNEDLESQKYLYYNIYTTEYVTKLLSKIPNISFKIIEDNNFIEFDNRTECGELATRTVGNLQISGNIVFDWRYIIIEKSE